MESPEPSDRSESAGRAADSDHVFQTLQRMIMLLDLPPGAMISQASLMERLGCGRTPLREALKRLEEEDLVEYFPNKGVAIAGLDINDFRALQEALVLIESGCARIAAVECSDADLAEMGSVIEQAKAAYARGDVRMVSEMDYEFHRIIAGTLSNHYLAKIMTRLHRHGTRFSCVSWGRQANATASWDEHSQIVDALRNHQPDEAERLVREHTIGSSARIQGALRVR